MYLIVTEPNNSESYLDDCNLNGIVKDPTSIVAYAWSMAEQI